MKNWIFRTSALAFVAGLAGTLACGSNSACGGGTNINSNTGPAPLTEACGPGTYMVNNTCYSTNVNGAAQSNKVNAN